jgi:hypothetical protein
VKLITSDPSWRHLACAGILTAVIVFYIGTGEVRPSNQPYYRLMLNTTW